MILLVLLACSGSGLSRIETEHGEYWLYVPEDVAPDATVVVHLHAHDGSGQRFAESAGLQDAFAEAGLVVAYPEGVGGNWSVGHHVEEIDRDDRAFLQEVAEDLGRRRRKAGSIWLSGHSEGAAMTYDMACLGPAAYDGYLPIAGAFWEPAPASCHGPAAPIRHLQGTNDDTWPLDSVPEGWHTGIRDSLRLLKAAEGCEAVVDEDGCEVWTGCAAPVALCLYEGRHAPPAGWPQLDGAWIEGASP